MPVEEGDTELVLAVRWGFPHDAQFEKAAVAYLTVAFSTLQSFPQLGKLKPNEYATIT